MKEKNKKIFKPYTKFTVTSKSDTKFNIKAYLWRYYIITSSEALFLAFIDLSFSLSKGKR